MSVRPRAAQPVSPSFPTSPESPMSQNTSKSSVLLNLVSANLPMAALRSSDELVAVLSLLGAGCLGAVLMVLVLGLALLCYVCKERRSRQTLREKERDIVKRRTSSNAGIRGHKWTLFYLFPRRLITWNRIPLWKCFSVVIFKMLTVLCLFWHRHGAVLELNLNFHWPPSVWRQCHERELVTMDFNRTGKAITI